MKNILARRTALIDASGIRKVFALAGSLKDPVNFSIGQPDFDVPELLKAEAIAAIESGANSYSMTAGIEQLRERISQKISDKLGWQNPHTLVTSGVSGGLLLTFMSLIDPGDEVIISDPYFVIYKHLINLLGGKCVFIDTYPDFGLHVENIEAAITKKTKLIIVNSPANPTGAVHSEDELKKLADVARKKDVIVLSDEIYSKFCYDGPCPTIANFYEKTLVMDGFSKAYAMTGWRLGYVAAHPYLAEIIEQMIKIQQYTFVCAPTPFQKAAVAAMDFDVSEYVARYRGKRDMIYNGLKDKFDIVKPGGAFYMFVKVPTGNATDFVKKAIDNNVLVIPGNVFSEKDTHFRISYATTKEKIAQGIRILNSLA
ncbi:MAG: aminotransferase class I/II-fold pyridoxal phosphate-dependent enzyme [Phycisphaerae bacterium]|nr:aminotransferase class I/II-fold pyridoxal phosphate-dependent enzyme [Phycisphaerae bacterium]